MVLSRCAQEALFLQGRWEQLAQTGSPPTSQGSPLHTLLDAQAWAALESWCARSGWGQRQADPRKAVLPRHRPADPPGPSPWAVCSPFWETGS